MISVASFTTLDLFLVQNLNTGDESPADVEGGEEGHGDQAGGVHDGDEQSEQSEVWRGQMPRWHSHEQRGCRLVNISAAIARSLYHYHHYHLIILSSCDASSAGIIDNYS